MNRFLLATGAEMTLPGGESGGGTSYDPLAKSADPTVVPLSSGTTSSSASARTFTAPTDGSGSYTLSVALVQDVGTGAVLAGDNSSGWYVTGLEDGDVCRIVGTWEDDETGETVQNVVVVAVAGGGSSGAWALMGAVNLTTLTPTALSSGSQVVDGVTIYCSHAGESISASGLSVGNSKASYVQVDGYVTDLNRPILLIEQVEVTWSGTGLSSAVRGRFYSAVNGESPAFQLRCDALTSDVRAYIQWNARSPGGTGTFTTSPPRDLGSKPTTLYMHGAFIQGHYVAWLATSKSFPTTLTEVFQAAANSIYAICAAGSGTSTPWWNTELWAGLYRESSTAYLAAVEVYEWQD